MTSRDLWVAIFFTLAGIAISQPAHPAERILPVLSTFAPVSLAVCDARARKAGKPWLATATISWEMRVCGKSQWQTACYYREAA